MLVVWPSLKVIGGIPFCKGVLSLSKLEAMQFRVRRQSVQKSLLKVHEHVLTGMLVGRQHRFVIQVPERVRQLARAILPQKQGMIYGLDAAILH
jgi:hypothetical protein